VVIHGFEASKRMKLRITAIDAPLASERPFEIVERKGLGHPDSICDALAEELSLELSRFYLKRVGRILHHNVDKALLAAGVSQPRFGGGAVVEPMRIHLAGRASSSCGDVTTPIAELAEHSARRWLRAHLHALDAERHATISTLVRPGSAELVELFDAERSQPRPLANDTSCGVGFAPLSEVERVVLAVEQGLNSAETRTSEPAFGEDVKVMAVREGDAIELTVSCAMVDAAVADLADYARARDRVAERALRAAGEVTALPVTVAVNAADDLAAGRVYLTVTGTSGEAGDDGQTGRGNRVNGLITPCRLMTMESVAGKNPVTHVGKLYNLAASFAAERLVAELAGVRGAECMLVSRIGRPIQEPQRIEVRLAGVDAARDVDAARAAQRIVQEELERLPQLAEELVRGDTKIDRWPLRSIRAEGPAASV
jgi:S-adenosylmethionine synthetase